MQKVFTNIKAVAFMLIGGAMFFNALFLPVARAEGNGSVNEDRGPLGKITFIHYRNGQSVAKGAIKGGTSGSCYSYIAAGAKWKTLKDYSINTTDSNLNNEFVQQAISSGVTEWENYGGSNIFGTGSIDSTLPIGFNNDGKNVVFFGPWDDNNAIAVTTIWGYFAGSPKFREITEWDILFNTYYLWGDATVNGSLVMDLQNIATHELGHGAGMGDVYSAACSAQTMYGYSSYGETDDRTLNTGDIAGITKLYR